MNYYLSFLIKASVTKWVGRVVCKVREEKESGRLNVVKETKNQKILISHKHAHPAYHLLFWL